MKYPQSPRFFWICIHTGCAIAAAAAIIIIIHTIGFEIILIYLQTPFWHYPARMFAFLGAFLLYNCALALYGLLPLTKKGSNNPSNSIKIATAAILTVFCVIVIDVFRTQYQHVRNEAPTAPERLWTRVGPIIQLRQSGGPGTDAATSAVIWYFDPIPVREKPVIMYGSDRTPGTVQTAQKAAGDGKKHTFILSGLAPSTHYYYRIPAWGDRQYSFRTGPAAGQNGPVRFTVIGDTGNTHSGGYSHSYYRDIMAAADAWYRGQSEGPSFIIHAGDMVRTDTDLDAWHQFFSAWDGFALTPGLFAPGNHEFLEDRGANFRYFFGRRDYYSVDYGNIHILVLHPFDGPGKTLDGPVLSTGKDQYRFAREDLARNSGKKWVIVVIHIPLLSSGDYGQNPVLIAQYFRLFQQHRVDLVISGHDHNFDSYHVNRDTDWGGTIYIVAGTGGSHLDSYIMDRPMRKWPDWRHDRTSSFGLYQDDPLTDNYHVYGEISWGYTDVEIIGDTMTVSYYRWLDIERFLAITGQGGRAWDMVFLDEKTLRKNGVAKPVLARRIVKERKMDQLTSR